MQPTEQSRQQLRCALRDLGARAEKFNEEDLNNLLRERYQTLDDLREARANSLRAAGLPLALVDHTVAVQRASAAGLGVRSAAGAGAAAGVGTTRAGDAGAAAGLGVGSGAGAEELPTPKPPQEPPTSTPTQPRAAVGPASDSEAAGGTISALQATVDQILSCVQQLHGLVLVEFKWGRHGEDDEQTVKKATKFLRSIAPGGCCITPHIRPLILRRTRLSASCSIISERTNRGSGSLRCKELQRIFQDRRR
ncbi:hypothetical protein Vretifemale_6756 [Volvox reticuliferus]|uniref:Uncharacterized protein n=1 Tax=Volvox reticuliferus TaxID=1737510 RepID=A0A8J4CDS3_9CHLO|nr:hypothetical protein Vretifemale_6756 [Volvox reticuliferus]